MTQHDGENRHGSEAVDVRAVGSTWIYHMFCRHTHPWDRFRSDAAVGRVRAMIGGIPEKRQLIVRLQPSEGATAGRRAPAAETISRKRPTNLRSGEMPR